eukprot:TRINITY_DN3844_c0_g1_i3.p1 TRINITY_DN3844_c0_g1~~TRINITY_DN3844_c0_g1_i3.p1  ORF type:complete len:341 (+),score=120.78 TRINITY_DN3844_c0_g1_i3:504-1526(+)
MSNIPFEEITLIKQVGKGTGGVVWKAIWREAQVAAKRVHKDVARDGKALESLKKEATILSQLRPHMNVVLFLGVSIAEGGQIYLITEYLKHGSLEKLLKNSSIKMTLIRKIKILNKTARGVLHLHSEGIIHRDLASRNILLANSFEPKVSDFGMSTYASSMDAAETDGPLKWMAPESLQSGTFSTKSDVWAYGVVCWEVLTRSQPFPELTATQAAQETIHNGLRLSIPSECPPELAILIQSCWNSNPENRPDFKHICTTLQQILNSMKEDNDSSDEDKSFSSKQTTPNIGVNGTPMMGGHQYAATFASMAKSPDLEANLAWLRASQTPKMSSSMKSPLPS